MRELQASVPPSTKVALKGALRVPMAPTFRVTIHVRKDQMPEREHRGCCRKLAQMVALANSRSANDPACCFPSVYRSTVRLAVPGGQASGPNSQVMPWI
jgi:hypothetical protein